MTIFADTDPNLALVRRHRSGRYYGPLALGGAIATCIQGDARPCPFWVPEAGLYDRIVAEVTTVGEAGSLVRLGVYPADQETGEPLAASPLLDAGTIAGDGATGMKEITIAAQLPRGLIWLLAVNQACPTTAPLLRGSVATNQLYPVSAGTLAGFTSQAGSWQQTGVTGALPAGNFVFGNVTTGTPKVWLRKG